MKFLSWTIKLKFAFIILVCGFPRPHFPPFKFYAKRSRLFLPIFYYYYTCTIKPGSAMNSLFKLFDNIEIPDSLSRWAARRGQLPVTRRHPALRNIISRNPRRHLIFFLYSNFNESNLLPRRAVIAARLPFSSSYISVNFSLRIYPDSLIQVNKRVLFHAASCVEPWSDLQWLYNDNNKEELRTRWMVNNRNGCSE